MGFGKFVLGGVCAVGAVIAAPVVVPAAGIALATSTLTVGGAVGSAAMAVDQEWQWHHQRQLLQPQGLQLEQLG